MNVLLYRDFWAKLSDFGFAKLKIENQASQSNFKGTPNWLAPEVLCGDLAQSADSDMYALGMVLWELVTRRIPFADIPPAALPFQLFRGKKK